MTPTEPPGTSPAIKRTPLLLLLPCLVLFASAAHSQTTSPAPSPWRLIWSDEFNAPTGTLPDPGKWTSELGGKGFGNHELETYTSRPENVHQKDGNLVIAAIKEDLTGPDGVPRNYTSARIRTAGHLSQTYGRFEARIQLPLGKGIWPAFWLLGDNVDTVGWPKCGEIDILENIGEPATVYSTLHGPGYSGSHAIQGKLQLPAGEAVNTDFHLYALEWAPENIKFFLDGRLIAERTPANLPAGTHWAYDHPFFIILNLAVGGDWPGNPDDTTAFPQRMLVDFVRVYTREPSLSPSESNGKR